MNPDLQQLQPYPFERLARLKQGTQPPAGLSPIALSIGEPRHSAPGFVTETLIEHLHLLSSYPLTRGMDGLREAIADWLIRRFRLPLDSIDPERHVLPVNGTREALFAFAQAVVDRTTSPLVLMPNPFYQIYEGAALLAGAEPYFLNTTPETGYRPELESVPEAIWQRCQLIYLCSPGNPTGTVIGMAQLQRLIELADKYDFVIASDECYSEIYPDEGNPPTGLLQAAASLGRTDYHRCLVFHSLSKRSNLPGLRSGFVAGDADIVKQFLLYRTYHGCAMPPATQHASARAWKDESHVRINRKLYRAKFDAVLEILSPVMSVSRPDAGFYLWAQPPVGKENDNNPRVISEEPFVRRLFDKKNVSVLPGSYLSRKAHGSNPGNGYVRMALVAPLEECIEAAERIRDLINPL